MGALLRETEGVKKRSGYGYLFLWGPRWETWERGQMPGANVRKKVLGRVSLHIGAPLGDLGKGVPSTGNFERWMKRVLGMGSRSLSRPTAEVLEERFIYCVRWVMK